VVRLGDVATVVDSVENDKIAAWYNGRRGVILSVLRQPDANTVEVVDSVKALLPAFRQQIPPSVNIEVLSDRSVSIRNAVDDVQYTLMITVGLVVLVIFLFLRNVTATIIPGLALPVSIIGTFAGMYVLGYSIDNLSLLALTLSVGFVVDDAIVMLENIMRHVESGERPMEAAFRGARARRGLAGSSAWTGGAASSTFLAVVRVRRGFAATSDAEAADATAVGTSSPVLRGARGRRAAGVAALAAGSVDGAGSDLTTAGAASRAGRRASSARSWASSSGGTSLHGDPSLSRRGASVYWRGGRSCRGRSGRGPRGTGPRLGRGPVLKLPVPPPVGAPLRPKRSRSRATW